MGGHVVLYIYRLMEDKKITLEELYKKWINKKASDQEVEEFFDLLARVDVDNNLSSLMREEWGKTSVHHEHSEEQQVELVRAILTKYPLSQQKYDRPSTRIPFLKKRWFQYAAAILLALFFGSYFLKNENPKDIEELKKPIARQEVHIAPGGNRATLTLANGSNIVLEKMKNGQLIQLGGVRVINQKNEELIYVSDKAASSQPPEYNTLSTPVGGIYRLTLPDDSKVWLNAASSITFPTAFADSERRVYIKGEVYFEISKDKTKPFRIEVKDDIEIEVMGTQFNINAYKDELSINTTLIEGSINIKNETGIKKLTPGQQLRITPDGKTLLKKDVDLITVTAWKNDEFHFGEKSDFKSIMRQLSRWYDIEVEYKGNFTGHFGGAISRNNNLAQVLQLLEKTGEVKFEIEGKKIIAKQL